MSKAQMQVKEFHRTFGLVVNDKPTLGDEELKLLRFNLIEEELDELGVAYMKDNLEKVADALGDLLYVVYGAAVSHGIDMDPIMDEIHRSNMSKKGGYMRDDGKWVKPDNYSPANLGPILEKQTHGR